MYRLTCFDESRYDQFLHLLSQDVLHCSVEIGSAATRTIGQALQSNTYTRAHSCRANPTENPVVFAPILQTMTRGSIGSGLESVTYKPHRGNDMH